MSCLTMMSMALMMDRARRLRQLAYLNRALTGLRTVDLIRKYPALQLKILKLLKVLRRRTLLVEQMSGSCLRNVSHKRKGKYI